MNGAAQSLRALLTDAAGREEKGRAAAEWIRAERGYGWVGIYDVTADTIAAFAWTGGRAPAFPTFPRKQGLSGAAVEEGKPLIVQDVREDPRYLTTFGGTRSEAIFPVRSPKGEIVGTLDVESDRVGAFEPDDRTFLEECAVLLAVLWPAR